MPKRRLAPRAALVLLLLVSATVILAPAATSTGADRGRGARAGIGDSLEYLRGGKLSRTLDRYKHTGAAWVRFQLKWSTVQAVGPRTWDWRASDRLVEEVRARGLRPLVVLIATPKWARRAECAGEETCSPARPADFARFAGAAATRYEGLGVHAWEIWNEPNSAVFWKPRPNPAGYAALLEPTHRAIKTADAAATVVTGGTAPAYTHQGWVSPERFVSGMYRAGAQGSFEALGHHPYTYPAAPGTSQRDAWGQMYSGRLSLRALMVAHGDAGKQIWGTEFGAPTDRGSAGRVDETDQATMLTTAYSLWNAYPWTGPLIWYCFQDHGTQRGNVEDHFGLVRHDGKPKQALAAFSRLTGGP